MGVVDDLPRVTVRVDEDRAVTAPEGGRGLAADRCTGGSRLLGALVSQTSARAVVMSLTAPFASPKSIEVFGLK